ncbi:MAG: PLP-dependent aminotransferase family protein [Clostridia bacterium]|nr:PLP-dependent aminotransferase family protein [Clostridia bacterium]
MNYRVEKNGGKAAYLQVYEQLREDIAAGMYPFGSRLPSKRVLAEELGISLVTAEHAYSLLCDEGYAEARERSGYFVSFREGDVFLPPSAPLPPLPYVGGERGGDFPFSVLAKTMRRVLSEHGEALMVKPENKGCAPLRQALSRYLARSRGIHARPEQIVIGAGAEYLYGLLVELLGRERTYAVESPSYKQIERVYAANGVAFERLPLGQDGILSEALSASAATVLHITPYRSFPTGVTAGASKKREYLRWADDGRMLVEDDFESEFTLSHKPEETLFSLAERGNVVYVNTFSKSISPAFRVGYMVLPEALLDAFEQRVGFYSCTVPTFEQYVLAQLLDSGEFERHINRVRRRKRQGK